MAGSITATAADIGGSITKYTIVWTSDASGNVSANTVAVRRGRLLQAKFAPGAGGSQPTDLYDVTVADGDGVDVLAGAGANLSNANASIVAPTAPLLLDAGNLTPTVVNAGNAKSGTIALYVGP